MLITRVGIAIAEDRIKKLEESLREGNREASERYTASGDTWHDNPGWHRAVQEKGMIEGTLKDLRYSLGILEIIDDLPFDPSIVSPGSVVEVDYGEGDVEEYALLGSIEANPDNGIISCEADLAKAALGKGVGDMISFRGRTIRICSISRWEKLQPR